jgi:hypothetical protein
MSLGQRDLIISVITFLIYVGRFSEQISDCKASVFLARPNQVPKRTDEVLVGFRQELKPLYFDERKWLPLSHHTDFTLAVVYCTDLNSCCQMTARSWTITNG